jgi:glutathione peroxidase-family protein
MERSWSGMKVRLIQTGGFVGLTRSAEIDINQEEALALVRSLTTAASSHQPPPNIRDAFNHVLVVGDKRIPFSPEETPEEVKPIIERLISSLA